MEKQATRSKERGVFTCPRTGRVFVREKYDARFVDGARILRGKWKGETTGWMFEPAAEERVRALHSRIYGVTNGVHVLATATRVVPSLDMETVRLGDRILVAWKRHLAGSAYSLGQYQLVTGKGVEMRSGEITTWAGVMAVASGSTFFIRDVDPSFLDRDMDPWRLERASEPVPA